MALWTSHGSYPGGLPPNTIVKAIARNACQISRQKVHARCGSRPYGCPNCTGHVHMTTEDTHALAPG
jgi:hypothetical protein